MCISDLSPLDKHFSLAAMTSARFLLPSLSLFVLSKKNKNINCNYKTNICSTWLSRSWKDEAMWMFGVWLKPAREQKSSWETAMFAFTQKLPKLCILFSFVLVLIALIKLTIKILCSPGFFFLLSVSSWSCSHDTRWLWLGCSLLRTRLHKRTRMKVCPGRREQHKEESP